MGGYVFRFAVLYRVVPLIWLAFKVWMYVDVSKRRGVPDYWRWVVMLVPGGAVAYFFMVRLQANDAQALTRRLLADFRGPPPVAKYEHAFRQSPSLLNRLTLAQALYDNERFEDAEGHFIAALDQAPGDLDAKHGLALCRLERADPEEAKDLLLEIIDEKPALRDYMAFADAVRAAGRAGDLSLAVELAKELVVKAPRAEHVLLLAQAYEGMGMRDDATRELRRLVHDDSYEPKHVRRVSRPFVKEAKRLLKDWGVAP